MRYGLRVLLKAPAWTAALVTTLALGIGLTTSIFSLVYSLLLRALPYPKPEQLVSLWTTSSAAAAANVARFNVSAADWMDWRDHSTVFQDIALVRLVNFSLTGDGPPERLQGVRASWNLSQVLGLQPVLGRMFTEEENKRNARVIVISYGFWNRRFARDPGVVGRVIRLDDEGYQIVGVMPREFMFPTTDCEVWAPAFIPADEVRSRFVFLYRSVGRLKPGVTLPRAQTEMSVLMNRLQQQYPASNGAHKLGALVESLRDSVVGQFRTILLVLLAAVACLLLISCANIGSLLLARAGARTRDFAIMAALGIGAPRLLRQMLTELIPLGLAGAVVGVLLSSWVLRLLIPWLPPQLAGVESIGLHWPVLFFALSLSLLVVALAGVVPIRLASRVDVAAVMQQQSRGVTGGGAIRNALVAAQIAVTLVLLFAGSLLARSLAAVMNVNPGFSAQSILTMSMAVSQAKYRSNSEIANYYDVLAAKVKAIPGVVGIAFISVLPLSGAREVRPITCEVNVDQGQIGADSRAVTPGYFSAMGIPMVRGRDFTPHDNENAQLVGIVDEEIARRCFGDMDPLGKRFRAALGATNSPWIQVVGVVGHVRSESLDADPRPQMYWPMAQHTQNRAALVVRTSGRPESFANAVTAQIRGENPDQPVYDVLAMRDRVDKSLQSRHLVTGLVVLFGGSSLLLACVGLYGVISYGVALRSREFGIRIALGAQHHAVQGIVISHVLRLWAAGSALGLLAIWPTGRALQSLLYGIGSANLAALAFAATLLLVTGLTAAFAPMRRAARVDPATTLRAD